MSKKTPMKCPSRYRPTLAALASALFLAGCAVGPDYERPAFDLSAAWRSSEEADVPTQTLRKADTFGERWWSIYADPVLDRLIDEALEHNADARAAAAATEAIDKLLLHTRLDTQPLLEEAGLIEEALKEIKKKTGESEELAKKRSIMYG